MSRLLFDGDENSLRLFDDKGKQIGGPWQATNRPDSTSTLTAIPDGNYLFKDRHTAHRHGQEKGKDGIQLDALNGSYGTYGILRLQNVKIDGILHTDLGVHAGRLHKRDGLGFFGPFHATHGCVRTTEQAMQAISAVIARDQLQVLEVRNNGKYSK